METKKVSDADKVRAEIMLVAEGEIFDSRIFIGKVAKTSNVSSLLIMLEKAGEIESVGRRKVGRQHSHIYKVKTLQPLGLTGAQARARNKLLRQRSTTDGLHGWRSLVPHLFNDALAGAFNKVMFSQKL